jgi:cell division protease FtsH
MLGLRREGMVLTDEEIQHLSYHEGGHAVIAALLPNADPIHKVTIVPRGRAMGVTQQLPERDKYIYSKEYLLDRLAVMMGGRASEELVFGTATSGAENDLKEATKLARRMVLDWGMSQQFDSIALGGHREHVFLGEQIGSPREYSEDTAREADQEVKAILDAAFSRAMKTLKSHREALDRVAKTLREKEELPGSEVLEILGIDPEKAMPSLAADGREETDAGSAE